MGDWADDLAKEKIRWILDASPDPKLQIEYLAVLLRVAESKGRLAALQVITGDK